MPKQKTPFMALSYQYVCSAGWQPIWVAIEALIIPTQVGYTLPISCWASFKFSCLTQWTGRATLDPTVPDLEAFFPFQSSVFGFKGMM